MECNWQTCESVKWDRNAGNTEGTHFYSLPAPSQLLEIYDCGRVAHFSSLNTPESTGERGVWREYLGRTENHFWQVERAAMWHHNNVTPVNPSTHPNKTTRSSTLWMMQHSSTYVIFLNMGHSLEAKDPAELCFSGWTVITGFYIKFGAADIPINHQISAGSRDLG